MTIDMSRLKSTALRLWRESQLPGDAGQRYFERKAALMGADPAELADVALYVTHLQEALQLLETLAPRGELTSLAQEEFADFCDLAGLEDEIPMIIERHQSGGQNTNAGLSDNTGSSTLLPIKTIQAEHVFDMGESAKIENSSETILINITDQTIWLDFIRMASAHLTSVKRQLEGASSAKQLLAINLPELIAQRLENVELIISAELVRRGHLKNESVFFASKREFLMQRVCDMHIALQQISRENHAVTAEFSDAQRGGSRSVAIGSMGMIAAAEAMNAVGGLFSGVGRWNRTRQFANELDRQTIEIFSQAMEDLVAEFGDVLSAYYDVLCELGLESSGVMLSRMHDAHYVVDRITHIESTTDRLTALNQARSEYPFVDLDWLFALAELVPFVGAAVLPVLDAASSTYVGERCDLELLRVLVGLSKGTDDVFAEALRLSGIKQFQLSVLNGPWPIGVQEADLTQRTKLALGLVGRGLGEMLPSDAAVRQALLGLLRSKQGNVDTVATLLQVLVSLRARQWSLAAQLIGTLRAKSDAQAAHRVLEGLFLGCLCNPATLGTVETVSSVCNVLGLDERAMAKSRRDDGSDLVFVALWSAFSRGNLVEAQHLSDGLPEDFRAVTLPTQVAWFGAREITDCPGPDVLDMLFRRLLREGLFEKFNLGNDWLSLLYAVQRLPNISPVWEDSLVRMLKGLRDEDTCTVGCVWGELAASARGLMQAKLLTCQLAVTGYERDRDRHVLIQIVATGARPAQLERFVQDEGLFQDLEAAHNSLADKAQSWAHGRLRRTHELAPTLLRLDSPGSHRLNNAQRRTLCDFVASGKEDFAALMLPDHLLGCWIDEKAQILVFANGLATHIRSSGAWRFTPLEGLRRVSCSGWVNDYLKLEIDGDIVEIPASLNSEIRSSHDLLLHFINGLLVDAVNSYREGRDAIWDALDLSDWIKLAGRSELRSRYVVQFYINDDSLFAALEVAGKVPDSQSQNVQKCVADADAKDDARAEWFEGLRDAARKIPIGRTTTLYTCSKLEDRKVKEFAKRVSEKLPPFGFQPEDILVYYDETVTGVGDRGVAVCPEYFVWTVDGEGAFPWASIKEFSISGMLNKKLVVTLVDDTRYQMVLTQGNKEVELLAQFARYLLAEVVRISWTQR